eukprot:5763842-Pyramimonas_sp.AAC.1
MAAQIKDASEKFEATAKAVTAKASSEFLASLTQITSDLSRRHEATERAITAVNFRTNALEVQNAELKSAVA